jgi:hypothetical protein
MGNKRITAFSKTCQDFSAQAHIQMKGKRETMM